MQTPVNEYHSEMSSSSRHFDKSDRHFDKSDQIFDKSDQMFNKSDRMFDKSDRHFDKSDRMFDKNDKFGEMSSTPTSRSLNPEILMREFMHDEDESSQDSPSPGFKSSFAREVMQVFAQTI